MSEMKAAALKNLRWRCPPGCRKGDLFADLRVLDRDSERFALHEIPMADLVGERTVELRFRRFRFSKFLLGREMCVLLLLEIVLEL